MSSSDIIGSVYEEIKEKLTNLKNLDIEDFELLRRFSIYDEPMFENSDVQLIVVDVDGDLYAFRAKIIENDIDYFEQPYKAVFEKSENGGLFIAPLVLN